ncbi:MAG: PfkB family carbohydrate kinase [Armatimonadota bacterium]
MNRQSPRIIGSGICCLDYIVTAPQVNWGDTAIVKDYQVQGGGLVATALVACARLGAQCDVVSILGDDSTADLIINELISENVNTEWITRVPGGASPFSFVHVDPVSGDRTIFHRPGSGDANPKQPSTFEGYDAAIVDDIFPEMAIATAQACKKSGVPVIADLIPSDDNREMLNYVDVLIAPRHYARQLGYGDNPQNALDDIHRLGPTTAVITMGADGFVYSDASGQGRGDAFQVEVVDTTGAGDTFHGAFAYALTQGWDTLKCCEFASAVAAIKCTKPGGRTGLPTLEQALEFLRREHRDF